MTTALYRRYRPDTFADVIGQSHVTDALERAIDNSKVAHAFLFSGPRGCGKTTSARILARSLNCAQGPTSTPCGKCESCVELASGGPGSLDVIEIDAASHSGVAEARSLRERAGFAPVRDRYRIFILDEAHMVTSHGFNALLKLVEEPPEHVKFIFATTEPEKVLTTIRSRTHHYPFRLVPPGTLTPFLKEIAAQEGVPVDESVLPLVVRAGGGSVRDSLSVLDQLMAGSDDKVSYASAAKLLGFTDAALLERMVDALGAGDGAAAFQTLEEVFEAGFEPRRFLEDLLARFRDLIVCSLAGPVRAAEILEDIPAGDLEVMLKQAQQAGTKTLSAVADKLEETLRSMTGATSPRLQLELLVGRLLSAGGQPSPVQSVPAPAASVPEPTGVEPTAQKRPEPVTPEPGTPEPVTPEPEAQEPAGSKTQPSESPAPKSAVTVQEQNPTEPDQTEPGQTESNSVTPSPAPTRQVEEPTIDQMRAQWTPLLAGLRSRSAVLYGLIGMTRGVETVNGTVNFTFKDSAAVDRFKAGGGEQHLAEVVSEIFGRALGARVGTAEQLAGQPAQSEPGAPAPEAPASQVPEVQTPEPQASEPQTAEAQSADPGVQEPQTSEVQTPKPEKPEPETSAAPDPAVAPDLAVASDPAPEVVDSVWDEPAPEDPAPTPTFVTAPSQSQPQPATPSEPGDLSRYASMLPADRVLDILGGQIVEEFIEEPKDK